MNPTGTVTFLFTDIEGSTKLAQSDHDKLHKALEKHNNILNKVVQSNNGFVFKITGDAFCAAFNNSEDAVKASTDAQFKIFTEDWGEFEIKVRMGIHRGSAEWSGTDYMGYITLARTSRVMSSAYGGQILISEDAYQNLNENIVGNLSYRDLGERRLKDLIKPMKLYQIISENYPSDFPPLKTLDARPNNLPIQLTSFIGREKEISEVKEQLSGTRLLTMIGSGGTGKTRLALQVGADMIDEFTNGVWIIELAPVQDPLLLPQTVAEALNLREQPEESIEKTILDFLINKEILLILDNCEHLINACAVLAEKFLKNSTGTKIIATSREALRCEGEFIHKVLTLGHPDPDIKTTIEQLTQYEAVRLFIERAISVNPSFRVNNENAPALAQICYQLDGIPLAIELAAVRIKILTPEKICEKLDDRFKILTGGKRTALPRQQTLKALIDWSYDLLTDKEKILWNRLSVFSGGWTLTEAEEICSDEMLEHSEIFDLTNELIEKSVISFIEKTNKYKMLETIKQYGEYRLIETEESDLIQHKHLLYYLNIYEKASAEYNGPKAKYWLDKIEFDYFNLQKAIYWAMENNFRDEAGRLALSYGIYWDLRGNFSEGRILLEKILSDVSEISPAVKANLTRQAGILATQQGQHEIAVKFSEECLEIFRSIGDKKGIANSLNVLGLINYDICDYEKSKIYLYESLILKRELGNKVGICSTLNSLGLVYLICGEFDNAKIHLEEGLSLAIEAKDDMYLSICYNNLAEVYANLDDNEKSKEYFEHALEIDKKLGNKKGICVTLYNLGMMAYTNKDFEKAKLIYEESYALSLELEYRLITMYNLLGLGQVSVVTNKIDIAVKYYSECINLLKEHYDMKCAVLSLVGFAEIYSIKRDFELAVKLVTVAKMKCDSTGTVIDINFNSVADTLINSVKNEIGADETDKLIESSKKITFEEAIDIALSKIQK